MKYLKLVWPKTELAQVLVISALFSLGLVWFRFIYTGYTLFMFLVWNLFLAYIPLIISGWLEKMKTSISRLKFFVVGMIWLMFIPNSFYIITDLFHLFKNETMPLWYDLALLFSFAWTGLLFGIISVRQVERVFESFFPKKYELLFIIPVMFLNGLGVYIGRYLRFNSWDVIANPLQLASEMVYLFMHPLQNRLDWSMIICYSTLMTVIYIAARKLSKIM